MSVRNAVPRSLWPLLGLLLLAAAWLLFGSGDETAVRGPALPALDAGCERLTVRTPRGLTRLERTGAEWRLDGTVRDLVDAEAVALLLEELADAERSAPLDGSADLSPSTFGLGAGAAREVIVENARGRSVLRVGLQNPALGHYHAQDDAGALVLVTEGLVAVLDGLPDRVRARTLWPGFRRDDADTVDVVYPGAERPERFVRGDDGRWWWRRSDALSPDSVLHAYQAAAADRRRTDAAGEWWLARDRVLGNLGALLEDLGVQAFPNLEGGREDAPGPDVRIAAGGREHRVLFGPPAGEAELLAWRDDAPAPVVVLDRILRDWTPALDAALHADVLTRGLAEADSFALSREDLGAARVLAGADGAWRVPTAAPGDDRAPLVAADLVFFLEHLAIRSVLPAPADGAPRWRGAPAFVLDVWRTGPGVPPRERLVFGVDEPSGRPAVWAETGGLLLEVDREGPISGRTFITRFGAAP